MSKRNLVVRGRSFQFVAAAAAAVAGALASARAGTYTWLNPNSGALSPAANWAENLSPAADPSAQLVFGTGTYFLTNDVGTLNVNSLTFNNDPADSSSLITVVGATTINLDGPNAGIFVNGGNVNFNDNTQQSGSVQLSTQHGMSIQNAGAGKVTLGSMIYNSGPVNFVNSGSGSIYIADTFAANGGVPSYSNLDAVLNIYSSGNSAATAGVFVGGFGPTTGVLGSGVNGHVNVKTGYAAAWDGTNSDLFNTYQILNVSAGATFDFLNNAETMGGIEGDGTIVLGNSAGLTMTMVGDRTWNGHIVGGTGTVTVNNPSNFYMGGSNSFSGAFTINGGAKVHLTKAGVLSATSPVSIFGGDLDIGGFDQSVASIIGRNRSGSFDLGAATLTIDGTSTADAKFLSPITGTGNIVSSYAGTQGLLGNNTYLGTTTVTAGTLRVGGSNLLSNAGSTISAGATLGVVLNTDGTWTAPISDAGGFQKEGTGTLTFNAARSTMALTNLTILGGTLKLDQSSDSGNLIGASPALTMGSGALALIGNNAAQSTQSFSGTTLRGAAKINVTSGVSQDATVALGSITRGVGSTLDIGLTNVGTGVAHVTTITPNNAAGTMGAYATVGGSTWAVSGNSTSTGPFAISGLPESAYTANAVGTSNVTGSTIHLNVTSSFTGTPASGATPTVADVRFNTPVAATYTVSGNTTLTYGGILVTPNVGANNSVISGGTTIKAPANTDVVVQQNNAAGLLTISSVISNVAGTPVTFNNVTVASTANVQTVTVPDTSALSIGEIVTTTGFSTAMSNGHIVSINSPTSVTINYSVAPSGSTGVAGITFTPETNVVKAGPGTMVLTANNAFSGVLALKEGTVQVGAAATMGSAGASSSTLYFDGGTLNMTVGVGGGAGIQPWVFGPAGGNIIVAPGTSSSKQGSTVYGTGDMHLTGGGIFAIGSNKSTWSGALFIDGGTVFRMTSNQLTSATGMTVADGSQFNLNDTSPTTYTLGSGAIYTFSGNGPNGTGAFLHSLQSGELGSSAMTIGSQVYLAADSRFSFVQRVTDGVIDTVVDTFNQAMTGPGNLTKDGDGTMVLSSSNNSYGGDNGRTTISNGTLRIGADDGLPRSTTLQFGETGSSNSGVFDLRGFNQTVAGLASAGSGTGHKIISVNATVVPSTFTVNYNGAAVQTFTGQIGDGSVTGPTSNNFNFTKTGTGTLSLFGTTTYSGTATVAQGTLRVTGNAVARPYVVNDGATLSIVNFDGTALQATALQLGTSGSSTLGFEFLNGTPTSGAISISNAGGLVLNGQVNVSIAAAQGLAAGTIPLINYQGTIGGSGFSALGTLSLPNRVTGNLVNDVANHSIDLVITGVDFLKWSGNLSSNWDVSTTANFKLNSDDSAQVYTDVPAPDAVAFDETASGSHNVNLTTTLSPASVSVSGPSDYTFSGPGRLASGTSLTKSGTGTLTVLTNDVNTGKTVISGGTVQIGNGGTSGSLGGGAITDNGALVINRSDDLSLASDISGSGSFSKLGTNNLSLSGSLNLGGSVTVAGGTLTVGAGTIGGNVSGGGALAKQGTGTMILTGNVTTTGTTVINAGVLQVGSNGTSGSLQTDVSIAGSGTLAFARADAITYANAISGAGGISVLSGSVKLTGSLTYAGTTAVGANTLEFASDSDTNLQATLSGTNQVIKSGAGTLTLLSSNNAFTGTMTINSGAVVLTDRGAGGDLNATQIVINGGGKFVFGETNAITGSNPDLGANVYATINTGGTFETYIGEDYGGFQLLGGTFIAHANSNAGGTTTPFGGFDIRSGSIVGDGAGGLNINNVNTIANGGGFTKTTPATAYVLGTLAIGTSLPIQVYEGTLSMDGGTIPNTTIATTYTDPSTGGPQVGLTIGRGSTDASFQLHGATTGTFARSVVIATAGSTVDVADPAGRLTFSPIEQVVNTGGTLSYTSSVAMTNQTSNGVTGTTALLTTMSSQFGLNKTGPGTLVLAGVNSIAGNYNVAGGTLVLQNTLATYKYTGAYTGNNVLTGGVTLANITSVVSGTATVYTDLMLLNPVNTTTQAILVGPGATAQVSVAAGANVFKGHIVSQFGAISVATTGTFSIASVNRANVGQQIVTLASLDGVQGTFDIGNNDVLLTGTTEAAVDALAFNHQLVTTATDTAFGGVAVITNSDGMGGALFATFDGLTVTTSDVLVKYTYVGDTDLNGSVDGTDLANLLAGMSGGLRGWINGDLNYDGHVDTVDLSLLLASLQGQGGSLGDPAGGGGGAVPEPSMLAPLAITGLALGRRRRRA